MKGKVKELECVECGEKFIGVGAYFCKSCREKRRLKGVAKANKEHVRDDYYKDNRESHANLQKYSEKIKSGQKFLKPDVCPNFDKTSMTCVVCPAGAYKFKACGRK